MPEWLNIFNANADPSDPTSSAALALRQRIALGLMEKKRAYPKTFGEGLAAIGDSLGEIGMSRQLVAQQAGLTSAAQVWMATSCLALPEPPVAIVVEQAVQL